MSNNLKIGDKVTFDTDQVETFKQETSGRYKAIKDYQRLVLGGINQVGVVKEFTGNLTTVSYPDGWDLTVPTKYLVVLP
jgi:transcription elongation factor